MRHPQSLFVLNVRQIKFYICTRVVQCDKWKDYKKVQWNL